MGPTKILLADDDLDHLNLIRDLLTRERAAVEVTTVSTRSEFLAEVNRTSFDCVVLDYHLPPHTAPDLLRDLDRYQPGVPRIVVSSSEEQAIVINSVREGALDFVQKHNAIECEVLWDRIDSAMRMAKTERVEKRELDRRLRALETRAKLDALTGVLNRGGAEMALERVRRTGDRRALTSVTFVDLDHFKRVNDELGHDEGDRVLREAAGVLRELANGGTLVARWGGEEFLLVRNCANLCEAWNFGETIRRTISERVKLPSQLLPQTASIGVDLVPSEQLCVDIVRRADQAMYLAKDGGRDRVCTWPMVRAMDVAHECATFTGKTVQQRLQMLIRRLWNELGGIQREHACEHGQQVGQLVMAIARELPLSNRSLDALKLAAENHDIGKVGVPEELLALPRALTSNERQFINEHARFGAELLRACGADDVACSIVQHHHDRFDRREDRCASEPPLAAEILCACDAAITIMSDRPYSKARTRDQMLAELSVERGMQFHPKVVDAMSRAIRPMAA